MKLFLAATHAKPWLGDNLKSACYILESFYYFKDWQAYYLKNHWKSFLLDSGAFTFRENNARTGRKVDYEAYTHQYAAFINQHNIELFFEMDIDDIVGLAEVERLRDIMERETGKKSIPVWHIGRGKQYFIDMCKAYPYVAVGGIAGGTQQDYKKFHYFFPWFINTAHTHGAKIHGLGFTPRNVGDFNFDSVDSTSWTSGSRFALIYHFQNGVIRQETRKGMRLKDYKALDTHNFKEWVKLQSYLDGG